MYRTHLKSIKVNEIHQETLALYVNSVCIVRLHLMLTGLCDLKPNHYKETTAPQANESDSYSTFLVKNTSPNFQIKTQIILVLNSEINVNYHLRKINKNK